MNQISEIIIDGEKALRVVGVTRSVSSVLKTKKICIKAVSNWAHEIIVFNESYMEGALDVLKAISYYVDLRQRVAFFERVILGLNCHESNPDCFMMQCLLSRHKGFWIVKLSCMALGITGTKTRETFTTH